jgi:hypothetical protein
MPLKNPDLSTQISLEIERKKENQERLAKHIIQLLEKVKTFTITEHKYACMYCQDVLFLPYINKKEHAEYVARCYCSEDYILKERIDVLDRQINNTSDELVIKGLKSDKAKLESLKKYTMFSQIKQYPENKFKAKHLEYMSIVDERDMQKYPRGYLDYYLEYKNEYFKKIGENIKNNLFNADENKNKLD